MATFAPWSLRTAPSAAAPIARASAAPWRALSSRRAVAAGGEVGTDRHRDALRTARGGAPRERAPLDVSARAARGGRGGRGGRRGGASGGGRGGAGGRGASDRSKRAAGRGRGKPIRAPPPPPPAPGVRPAGMRKRVAVRVSTNGESPFADLRGGPLLSPAARKDPAKAQEERRKIWARLGAEDPSASASSSTPRGFSHLLDADPNANASSSSSGNPRGTSRGANGTRQRGSSRATLRVGFTAHREKFAKALRLELEEEMDRAKERLDTWDRARLQREGYALFGLRGMRDGTLQRDAVIRVLKPRVGGFGAESESENPGAPAPLRRGFAMGAELPFHRFAQGDMVSLTEGDDHDETGASSVQGVVVERAMHFLKIAVSEDDERKVLDSRRLRLDLSANTISHDRAVSALMAFSEAGGMPGYDETSAGRRLSSTAYAPLQRAMIGIPDGGGDLESVARVSPPWAGKGEASKMRAALSASSVDRLNPSQRAAVRRAMGRTLSIWQGPPGTGKTRTLMSFVEAAVALAGAQGARRGASAGPTVLACAASNVAVDNIVEGLLDAERRGGGKLKLRVVRLGSPAKVQPWLVSATLGAQVAETAQGKRAAAMRAQARGDYTPRGAAARRAAFALEQGAASLVLARADVVCCTCVGAGDELLEGFTFRVACVDEATQCPEPAALIPLTKALSGVLVGDARQLPPTVVSRAAQRAGLGVSLFERLERLGLSPDLLDRQYRMHPSLAAFPSEAFYGGRVASDPDPTSRPAPLGFDWPDARCPLVFVEVDGGEERRAPDGLSVLNEREARAAVAAVERLLAAAPNQSDAKTVATRVPKPMKPIVVGGRASVRCPGDVGVIAPYAAQVRRVQELWTESKRRRGERDDGVAEDGDGSSSDPAKAAAAAEARAARELEVHSVDGFQGREKEVIVLCTVRANDAKKLGFVADDRRLNVAMTRAKRGLVVLGNRKTLESDETWRRWLRWVDQKGVATTASALGLLRGGEEERRGP